MFGQLIQYLTLKTQYPPFTSLYGAYYRIVLRRFAKRICKLDGIVSFYVVGGMSDEPIFGLSDIDLLIVTESQDIHPKIYRIHREYRSKYRVLAPPNEIGVLDRATLNELYQTFPSYEFAFGSKSRNKLVFGEDLFKSLGYLIPKDLQAESKMFMWWDRILDVYFYTRQGKCRSEGWLQSRLAIQNYFRSHMWYKVICELIILILYLKEDQYRYKRKELRELHEKLQKEFDEIGRVIKDPQVFPEITAVVLQSVRARLKNTFTFERGFVYLHELLSCYFLTKESLLTAQDNDSNCRLFIHINGGENESLNRLRETLIDDGVQDIHFIPALYFSKDIRGPTIDENGVILHAIKCDPFRLQHLDGYICWIEYTHLPTMMTIDRIRKDIDSPIVVDVIAEYNGIGYSIYRERSPWAIIHRSTHPELFHLKERLREGRHAKVSVPISSKRFNEIVNAYREKQNGISRLLQCTASTPLNSHDVWRLLAHCLETHYVLNSVSDDCITLCSSCSELRDEILASKHVSGGPLEKLLQLYVESENGEPDPDRFCHEAIETMNSLYIEHSKGPLVGQSIKRVS